MLKGMGSCERRLMESTALNDKLQDVWRLYGLIVKIYYIGRENQNITAYTYIYLYIYIFHNYSVGGS